MVVNSEFLISHLKKGAGNSLDCYVVTFSLKTKTTTTRLSGIYFFLF
ncbi:hypothetical protein DAI22_09g178700 [Oryza sativa Japonica Group]|nr:hypothetical protein DAI22_09g178700 [Oryza sativa Japonica Group]